MNNKVVKAGIGVAALACCVAITGCMTSAVDFLPSSAPIPPEGYTFCGLEVSGTSDQTWVFGFGGSTTESAQRRAFRDAMSQAPGADALVAMAIDLQSINFPPFYTRLTTRVTGTPVKFSVPRQENTSVK